MNNREYHTLQLGLQQVIAAYGTAPGYMWQPQTADPAYLRIERPDVDFLALAKSYGVTAGARVTKPKEVMRAVEEAVDHVLKKKTPYVLEIREAQSPQQPPTPPKTAESREAAQPRRFALQPPLNMFTQDRTESRERRVPDNVPVIF
jgi:benzoylformate decarboxylase